MSHLIKCWHLRNMDCVAQTTKKDEEHVFLKVKLWKDNT